MKQYVALAAMMLTAASGMAQETYENARLMEDELNGTARYVAMGGALDALGADISTISTNPAGIGLFRHSNLSTSFGLVSQEDGQNFRTGNKTNASFDQLGFVYSYRLDKTSFVNVAFNYHKSRNFDYILSAAGKTDGNSSQNGLSYIKGIGVDDAQGVSKFLYDEKTGYGTAYWTSQLDNLYYNALIVDKDGKTPYWSSASAFNMMRANTGYIGEYDINVSGNINNRLYLGLTVGIHDVHYNGISEYTEDIVNAKLEPKGSLTVEDDRHITGQGFDVKAGIIFRPIETSPFRIGLSVASPIFYRLKTQNYTRLYNALDASLNYMPIDPHYVAKSSYEFKMYTPWKFGVSLGHTIDNIVALGAVLEYTDYGSIDTRVITDEYYDEWTDTYQSDSESEREMNRHTSETLKGVTTLKLGAEVKIDPKMAVRFGYNYMSPMYSTSGSKDFSIDSYGVNCSSSTDYTNWKATHRFTCGLGFRFDKFNLDLAYQYSARKGEFHPFQDAWGDYHYLQDGEQLTEQIDIVSPSVSVTNNRHQVLLTMGYTF